MIPCDSPEFQEIDSAEIGTGHVVCRGVTPVPFVSLLVGGVRYILTPESAESIARELMAAVDRSKIGPVQ